MATLARYEDRQVAIGRVFARAFATIAANPVAVFGVAFVFGAVPSGAISLATTAWSFGGSTMGFALAGLVAFLVLIACAMVTQGALVRITVAHAAGRRASMREALVTGLRAIMPLVLLGILLALGVGFGLMLFLVPGVMLYIMWSVAAPALVDERRGMFAALARSRFLTKGARWSILALGLTTVVFYWLIAAVIGVGALVFAHLLNGSEPDVVSSTILEAISTTLSGAVWGTIQTSLYVELRDWKDGPASDRLADIFA